MTRRIPALRRRSPVLASRIVVALIVTIMLMITTIAALVAMAAGVGSALATATASRPARGRSALRRFRRWRASWLLASTPWRASSIPATASASWAGEPVQVCAGRCRRGSAAASDLFGCRSGLPAS